MGPRSARYRQENAVFWVPGNSHVANKSVGIVNIVLMVVKKALTRNVMHPADERKLRKMTSALVFDYTPSAGVEFSGMDPQEFKAIMEAAYIVSDEARSALQQWVNAGRRAGMSWTDVGIVLGVSKQAAQQRFGISPDLIGQDLDQEIEMRTGVTAFNELGILEVEGRRRRELVEVGLMTLMFRPSDHQWEYRRIVSISQPVLTDKSDKDWIYVASWFPFHYFKRPKTA